MYRYGLVLLSIIAVSASVYAQKSPSPDEAALAKIRFVAQTGGTRLDLCCLGLTEVPADVWALTHLKELVLASNQLATIPPEVVNLSELEVLGLSGNCVGQLPPEIYRLENLRQLNIDSMCLTELPADIGNLKQLEILFASDNYLVELPPEIGDLQSLRVLELVGNDLTGLPAEIKHLRNMRQFYFSYNAFASVPEEVTFLHPNTGMQYDGIPIAPEYESHSTVITEMRIARVPPPYRYTVPFWLTLAGLLVGVSGAVRIGGMWLRRMQG